INHRDGDGNTPLHCATERGKIEAVRFLIDRGADISCRDCDDLSPLCFAAARNHHDKIVLLLKRGADT
ncbi:ankyrin repeat-containing domain protein, partial [Apodospora peruviana]